MKLIDRDPDNNSILILTYLFQYDKKQNPEINKTMFR
jgi:hypothetical protein